MLLPAIAFFALFTYLPIANLLITSVHSGPRADVFAGLLWRKHPRPAARRPQPAARRAARE